MTLDRTSRDHIHLLALELLERFEGFGTTEDDDAPLPARFFECPEPSGHFERDVGVVSPDREPVDRFVTDERVDDPAEPRIMLSGELRHRLDSALHRRVPPQRRHTDVDERLGRVERVVEKPHDARADVVIVEDARE